MRRADEELAKNLWSSDEVACATSMSAATPSTASVETPRLSSCGGELHASFTATDDVERVTNFARSNGLILITLMILRPNGLLDERRVEIV